MKLKFYHILIIFFFNAALQSCKKNDYSYLDNIQNAADYSQSSVGKANAIIIQGQSFGDTTTAIPGAPIFLSSEANHPITVTAEIDTTLIDAYNQLYTTQYDLFPKGAFQLNTSTINIPTGSSTSKDSVKVLLKNGSLLRIGSTPYLIPIRLSTTDATLKSSIIFLKMDVTNARIFGRIINGGSWYEGNVYNYTNAVDNSMLLTYTVTQNFDDPVKGPDSLEFSPSLTAVLQSHDLKVVAEMSNADSIIEKFNAVNTANTKPFPEGTFEMLRDVATIPAADISNYNGLSLRFKNYEKFNENDTFLVALKVKNTNIPFAVEADTTTQYKNVYLKLKLDHVFHGNIDVANTKVNWTIANRSAWKVTSGYGPDESYYANYPSSVIDGQISTYWYSPGWSLPQNITIDAGSVQNFKGFELTPQYDNTSVDFLQVGIATSDDNINWHSQGYYFGDPVSATSSIDRPDIKNITFINAVSARYIRFNVTKSTAEYNTSIAEINGIQ